MSKRPGLYLYRDAWLAEQGLVMCSENARYLWVMMLMLMNENEPRGYLLVNGKPPTPHQLAVMTMTDPTMIEERLAELESAGVFSRDRRGVIFSRRMIRESRKARTARENGRKGGNPSLRKQTEIPPSDNQNGNPDVKPTSYKLQTRTQDSEYPSDTDTEEIPSSPTVDSATPGRPGGSPIEVVVGGIADPRSTRDFVERAMIFGANGELTLRKVRSWACQYGRDRTESALVDALLSARRNPVGYVEEVLSRKDNRRQAEMETARLREELGKPDPVMEADRMTREILARMETSNDDDTPSYPGLTH